MEETLDKRTFLTLWPCVGQTWTGLVSVRTHPLLLTRLKSMPSLTQTWRRWVWAGKTGARPSENTTNIHHLCAHRLVVCEHASLQQACNNDTCHKTVCSAPGLGMHAYLLRTFVGLCFKNTQAAVRDVCAAAIGRDVSERYIADILLVPLSFRSHASLLPACLSLSPVCTVRVGRTYPHPISRGRCDVLA